MLFTLFIVFLVAGLLLIFLGYYSKESAYSLIGWGFLFFLATNVLLSGNLEYYTGATINSTYAYNANNTITSSSIITTNNYDNLTGANARFFGLWLLMSSIAGIAISLSELQSAFGGKKNWG